MRVWLVVVANCYSKAASPASVDMVDVELTKHKRQKQKVSSGSACTRLLARLPCFSFFPPSCYCHENVMTGGEGGGWGLRHCATGMEVVVLAFSAVSLREWE